MKKLLLILLLSTSFASAQYGNNLLTAWVQGSVYTLDVLTTSGTTITSAIESTGNIGGAISNQWALAQSTADSFSITWTAYTLNSGTAPNLRYTLGGSGRGSISGSLNSFWTDADKKIHFVIGATNGTLETGVTTAALTNFSVSGIAVRVKLDTIYISAAGSNSAKGDAAAPIQTIAEAVSRGFYNGGVFAFRSGDSFDETFTAGNNCTLTVYGGGSPVIITEIADGGFSITQSPLINPITGNRIKHILNGYGEY